MSPAVPCDRHITPEKGILMDLKSETGSSNAVKCLRILIGVKLISILNSLLDLLPIVPSLLITLISWAAMAGSVLCLFRLASHQERYRKAALFRIGALVCVLFSTLFLSSSLVALASAVFSLLALYQEYYGHAGLIEDMDDDLAHKWGKLFLWSLVAGALTGIGTVTATLIVAMSTLDAGMITAVVVAVYVAVQTVIDVLYILYLRKTAAVYACGKDAAPSGSDQHV